MDTPDYSGEEEEASPEQMKQLHSLVEQLETAEREADDLEEQLKAKKKWVQQLAENDIPELMQSIGVKDLTTLNGLKVELKEDVRASFFTKNPEKRGPAFEWLHEHGHDGLIKNVVSAQFGKDQAEVAEAFVAYCKAFDRPVDVAQKQDIHHQTLLAFLREQLEMGTGVPLEKFGAIVQKFARIKRPKKKD